MKTRQVKLLSVVGCVSMLASAAFADVVPTSMVARDGRRVVARTEGTNVVYDLVTDADLPPARPWRIYVVKATHTDIGLHNSPYIQRHGTVKRIEDAMRLVDADTRADDDPAAYRYVVEGMWFWENYPMDRGEAAAWNVISNYVRRGRIDIACGCAGNHTHVMGPEELRRLPIPWRQRPRRSETAVKTIPRENRRQASARRFSAGKSRRIPPIHPIRCTEGTRRINRIKKNLPENRTATLRRSRMTV